MTEAPAAPAPFVGPLEDKDRIFTNVYGFQDWGIDAAMKRGDWDNTKKLLEPGPTSSVGCGKGRKRVT